MIKKYIKRRLEDLRYDLSHAQAIEAGRIEKEDYENTRSEDYYDGAINELEELLDELD